MADILSTERQQPDSTNKPDNDEFLRVVFQDAPVQHRPVVVSFAGNPNGGAKSKWNGAPWFTDSTLKAENNNYFSLSVYEADATGVIRRRKNSFQGLYAIMLDDIGTKVDMDKLDALEPSWLLETSPGNHQAGYLLASPIVDAQEADQLVKALLDDGNGDKGAGGPTARLARLPVGINGKREPTFHTAMKAWKPELRYTKAQIVEAFQLELGQTAQPKKTSSKPKVQARDEIFLPAPEDNPVIATLKDRGLYKKALGDSKHDITCPWCHEHTDGIDDGAAYIEPSGNYPAGGFKCHHSHGEGLNINKLLDYLGVSPAEARMRPSIRVIPGQLHLTVGYAEKVLADTGRYFQNGTGIVMLVREPVGGGVRLQMVASHPLTTALSACAAWERYDGRKQDFVPTDPPERVVNALAAATQYAYLPHLIGLAHQPYLRPTGELVKQAGYDTQSFLYGAFDPAAYQIPEEPTQEDAMAALGRLRGLLEEFPFAAEHDLAAALSAMLTAVLRPALPLAPMYHVQAPQIGSGKSLLCQLVGGMATDKRPTPTSFPANDEECHKVLLAELMRVPAVIEFDNLTSDLLPHKSLCTVLTSETFMGRILGVSKTAEVSTRTLFLSSGNNVGPVRDMTRRCISITLNPQCEMPATRQFKRPNLMGDFKAGRAGYVSDALTVVRAWVCAGRPQTPCLNVGSYGAWSEFCRQPLLWLGLPDPAHAMFETMENDADTALLGRLLHCWDKAFGRAPTMVRRAIEYAEEEIGSLVCNEEFNQVLDEIAGGRNGIDRQRLGWWIKRHANRVVDNMHFVKAEGTRAAVAWCVESVV